MTPEREDKFRRVIRHRQPSITVMLEDVHDAHNISAVIRTCDSVGIMEIYVLYTTTPIEKLKIGKRSSSGSRKWVNVHLYNNRTACFDAIRKKYNKIYATHLSTDAKQIYDVNLTESLALLFGNEHDGVSDASLALCDGNIIIPQFGMVESLNISVACAVTLYEMLRQRIAKDMYNTPQLDNDAQIQLFEEYTDREYQKKRKRR